MQPFDGVSVPIPQPAYPSASQQGYPQSSYPTVAQRSSYPQNYQAPYPNQPYQQPGGYPNHQAQPQPQYAVPQQRPNQGQDTAQKQVMTQPLTSNIKASGKDLVSLYSLFVAVVSVIIMYTLVSQTKYQILLNAHQKIAGRSFMTSDAFSMNACQAFVGGIIAVPVYLLIFAIVNFIAVCVSFTGFTCCMFVQPLAALLWAGTAVFASQQECYGNSVLISMFGANNIPQNAWTYYALMAGSSLVACGLNYFWSNKKNQAQKDQRSLSLMMAT